MDNYQNVIAEQGLNEIIYQKEFLTNPEFINPTKPVVLAAGTGAGKTTTTSLMLQMFFSNKANKGKKVIILPSSTKVLRDNFGDDIGKLKNRSFSYCVVNSKRAFKRALISDCDVICVLPQTLAGIEELPKVEWLVVDEAHKWYFADTIQNIITKTTPTYQLLLTGTPFKFNARKDEYSIYYVPVERLMELGQVGNPLIEVVSSSVNLKQEDYSTDNNQIRQDLYFTYKQDKDQLVSVAKEIAKTLKTRFRTNTIGRMLGVFGIDKTIIYCYSKKQARHFYKVFQSSELAGKVLISTSETDIDSVEFAKFKKHEEYRVLLVVDRGKEGFDMPELFNIIDFTLSTNPEIILQVMGRVLRISKEQPDKQKVYYKVASMNTAPFILTLMTGVLQLINMEYYSTFTGKFDELKVPMMPVDSKRPLRENNNSREKNNNFSTRALRYFQNANIPLTANFWNQLKFKQNDVWKTMGQTTLAQVQSEMIGKKGKGFMTKEYYDEVVSTYKITEYKQLAKINYSLALLAAKRGWDINLIKTDVSKTPKTPGNVKQFITDNKITLQSQWILFPKGQVYKKYYKQFVALGLLEDTVKKSKPGIKKGHTYSKADKKKMSKARKEAWVKQKENNFTLKTK